MGKIIGILVLVLAVAGLASWASRARIKLPEQKLVPIQESENRDSSSASSPTVGGYVAPEDASLAAKSVTVTATNFSFSPESISVRKGDKVRLTLKNEAGMHDLVINELNVKTKVLGKGQEQTVEFTADKSGTFAYYCSVGEHRELGMEGGLEIK